MPLRIGFIITSGFELGAAIYDFATCSWLVTCTLTYVTPPPIPTLSSPANDTTGVPIDPTLRWNASSGATSYTLQVSTSSSFSSLVVNQSGITATNYALTGLANSTKYYWRVSATNGSGSSGWSSVWNFTTIVITDNTPPATVPNLTTTNPTSSSITLTWTAPGDDGNTGTASQYDIRYSTATITESNWASATQCTGEPTPKSAGGSETFTVTGLSPNTTYYFAIKTADEVPNWSALSNVASGITPPLADNTPPSAITNLATGNATSSSVSLTWTAPGDDGNTGTASQYDIRYSTATITESNWASATQCTGEPTPKSAGGSETFTVTGLSPNTTYYFAIKTADEVPNWSALSNVPSATTPAAGTIQFVGSYNTPGWAGGVFVSGNYAYVADGDSGLQIINIFNSSSPALTGSYDTPDFAYEVFVSGNYAYVADRLSGLQIINISNPSSPALAGSYNTPGYAHGVFVSGNYAYVADEAEFQIINISNPSSPALAGSYDTPSLSYGVFVSGNYAYVADGLSGLQIINISNPSNPALAGSYDTPILSYGVFVSGNYAYVADGLSGLQIINISNPSSPALAGSYDTPDGSLGVFVSGNYAYVADWNSGLQIINISNPSSPALAGSYDTPSSAYGVFVSGNYVYVADASSGLQILKFVP